MKNRPPARTASASRRSALVFAFLSVSWLVAAVVATSPLPRVLEVWAALAFAWVAFTFWMGNARGFGKRTDGALSPLCWVLLAPYHAFNWLSMSLSWWLKRGDWMTQIAPDLWLGARLPSSAARAAGFGRVVDLAAELPEAHALRDVEDYRSHPTLDKTAPTELVELADWINAHRAHGRVFVHCAAGRGRSALVVAAALRRSGEAASAADALVLVERARKVELSAVQRTALEQLDQS